MTKHYIAITLLVLFAALSQEFILILKFATVVFCLLASFNFIVSSLKLSSLNPNHDDDFKYSPQEEWEKDEPWNKNNNE